MNIIIYTQHEFKPKKRNGWRRREPLDALILLWEHKVEKICIPETGIPGYDFHEFIDKINSKAQISTY